MARGMKTIKEFNLILAGVGGQGILLAGRVLCQAAMEKGYSVNSFESHGMAQRGGAVMNQLRLGTGVLSSMILESRTDMMVALEPVEALRWLPLLGKDSLVIMNDKAIPPITVSSVPGATYPKVKEVERALGPQVGKVLTIEGTALAEGLGNTTVLSALMIGAAWGTGKLPIGKELLIGSIKDLVPQRFIGLNIKAFGLGSKALRKG